MARGRGATAAKGKAKGKAKGPASRAKGRRAPSERGVARDVFSDEEDAAEERRLHANMDVDGVYEYEAPERFEHDSELDEDEAFDSQDEQDYGMFFRKQGKPARAGSDEEAAAAAADGDEEDDDEDDDGADAGGLLSDLLGSAPASRLSTADDDEDAAALAASDEEEGDDGDAAASSAVQLAGLQALADELAPAPAKRAPLRDIDASVGGAAAPLAGGALTLGSLLGAAEAAVDVSKVRKQVRGVETDGGAALQAALAPAQEARATRKAAYADKREEMDVFQPVVRRNRQKETLDLRQQGPRLDALTPAALASKFSAQTDMEKSVAALLATGDLSDRAVAADEREELERKQVSVREVQARQKELAKLRALMFYEEQKQKRVKKIKSKLYHKIRNAQDKKAAEKQRQQLRALDPELAKRLDDELAEKRAEERLTLRHTNTSKWVKHQLKRGVLADQGSRAAIAEQLQRGDELRRKMNAVDSDDDGDDSGDEEDEEDAEADGEGGGDAVSRLQKRLARQAQALVTEIDEDERSAGKLKGLHGMKFMQRAVQKQREKARVEAEKLLRELRGDGDRLLSDGDEAEGSDGSDGEPSGRKLKKEARKSASATAEERQAVDKALPKGSLQLGAVSMDSGLSARASGSIAVDLGDGAAETTDVQVATSVAPVLELGAGDKPQEGSKAATDKADGDRIELVKAEEASEPEDAEAGAGGDNPWLSTTSTKAQRRTGKKAKQRAKQQQQQQQQSGADVASAIESLAKSVAETGTKRSLEAAAATDAIPLSDESKSTKKKKSKKSKATAAASEESGGGSGGAASSGADDAALAPTQDELVRRAFAFADEDEDEIGKEKEALADADTQVKKGKELARLVGMTGWGSWAGEGVRVSRRQQQREAQAAKLAADTKKAVLAGRKDAKLARVLISEKKDKRAAKFAVADVPYPFTSREEYEQAMRNPLGSDWNTPAATSRLTAPKLMKRAGVMIQPLALSNEDRKMAKKELAKQRKARF